MLSKHALAVGLAVGLGQGGAVLFGLHESNTERSAAKQVVYVKSSQVGAREGDAQTGNERTVHLGDSAGGIDLILEAHKAKAT